MSRAIIIASNPSELEEQMFRYINRMGYDISFGAKPITRRRFAHEMCNKKFITQLFEEKNNG